MATDLIANTIPTVKQTTDDNIRLNQIVDSGVNIYGSREKIRANLVDLAKNYLKILEGDISRTSYLAYLIDTLSILTSNQIYYQSRIYNEFFGQYGSALAHKYLHTHYSPKQKYRF